MRRRALLATLGSASTIAGTAGCVETVPGLGTDESSLAISFDATVIESFDDDSPARLRLSFVNQSPEALALRPGVMRGISGPFTAIRGARPDDGRELLLFYRGVDVTRYALCDETTRSPIPEEPVDECWRPSCSDGLEVIIAHGTVELEPDEELVGEYTVLDGFDDGCLPPGTYEFEDETAIGPAATDEAGSGSEMQSLTRLLEIEIEEDGGVSATAEADVGEIDGDDSGSGGETPESESR